MQHSKHLADLHNPRVSILNTFITSSPRWGWRFCRGFQHGISCDWDSGDVNTSAGRCNTLGIRPKLSPAVVSLFIGCFQSRGTIMNIKLCTSAAAIALAISAGPSAAHPEHTSCGGGAPAVVDAFGLPIGPGPGFGTGFVAPIARAGAAAQTIATLHEAYCADEPGDQPPLRPQNNTQPSNGAARK